MVLEAVYEEEFLDCSYGFRPGRSAQQALDELHREAMRMAGGWVIEIDIRKYLTRSITSVWAKCCVVGYAMERFYA
jgi:retron-type reverse transcriptase